MKGADLLTKLLKENGRISHVHGVVGIPITILAETLVQWDIPFIGYRNEQAASYAASVEAFLSGGQKVGVMLTCGGPGFVNSLAGIFNALENRWPVLVLVGSTRDAPLDFHPTNKTFQELDHHNLLTGRNVIYRKLYSGTSNPENIIKEVLCACAPLPDRYGHVAVLEVSGIWLESKVKPESPSAGFGVNTDDEANTDYVICESSMPHFDEITNETIQKLCHGKTRPLIVFGKEAAFFELSEALDTLTKDLKVPFIMMPMARGLLDDRHPMHVAAARSQALKECNLLILLGTPLNWMLPLSDLFNPARNIQLALFDIVPSSLTMEEKDKCQYFCAGFQSSFQAILQISHCLKDEIGPWLTFLRTECSKNEQRLQSLLNLECTPLNYHCVYRVLQDYITPQTILVNEGSTTLDVARVVLPSYRPRRRLDPGTFATEGIGLPYVIAARLRHPNSATNPIIYVCGDSGFGFSMPEVETILRYGLDNITIIIMNNSGIYSGIDEGQWNNGYVRSKIPFRLPPTALMPGIRYDEYVRMFPERNIQGFQVTNLNELKQALENSHKIQSVSIINVIIDPKAGRVPAHR